MRAQRSTGGACQGQSEPRTLLVLLSPLALLSLLCLPTASLACYNAVGDQMSTLTKTTYVKQAEHLIEQGDPRKALALLDKVGQEFDDRHLQRRAQRTRLAAELDLQRLAPPEAARTAELRRIVRDLRILAQVDSDPTLATLAADAYALLGKTAEAAALLEPLASLDVVPDARGWRTLATLRTGSARDEALARCRGAALNPDLCAL